MQNFLLSDDMISMQKILSKPKKSIRTNKQVLKGGKSTKSIYKINCTSIYL